jgi:dCTP deaminase
MNMRVSTVAGILPDRMLRDAMTAGWIAGADEACVQPSSIDLTLSAQAWEVPASFLPHGAPVIDRIVSFGGRPVDLSEGYVLEPDRIHLVRCREDLALPQGMSAVFNAKSSSGRLDLFVRAVHDGGRCFDETAEGASGGIWLEVVARSFPVLVREGSRLAQVRLCSGAARRSIGDEELGTLLPSTSSISGGLLAHVDLAPDASGTSGWKSVRRPGSAPVDVDRPGACDPAGYFEPVELRSGALLLEPGSFYILRSREHIMVPPSCAAEMVALDPTSGEFRAHYAGFFDPGFGWGAGNESRGVLEVRAHDIPFVLEDGQAIARLVYHPMAGLPEKAYGGGCGSNYQGQDLRLSKHFLATPMDEPSKVRLSL